MIFNATRRLSHPSVGPAIGQSSWRRPSCLETRGGHHASRRASTDRPVAQHLSMVGPGDWIEWIGRFLFEGIERGFAAALCCAALRLRRHVSLAARRRAIRNPHIARKTTASNPKTRDCEDVSGCPQPGLASAQEGAGAPWPEGTSSSCVRGLARPAGGGRAPAPETSKTGPFPRVQSAHDMDLVTLLSGCQGLERRWRR